MQENEVTQQQNSNETPKEKTPNPTGHPKQSSHANAKKQVSQNPQNGEVKEPTAEAGEKKPRNNRRRKGNKSPAASIEGNELWQRDMKKAIEANQKMHKDRLNRSNLIDQTSKGKIKITPLGGLGEIGGNICVFETDTSAIVLDVGMSFPSEDMHGVDILVPDFSYLRQIKKKIAGIIISHAHEDHIGAVSYLFKEMQFPLYATPLPLGMLANKFDEHGLKAYKKYFRPVEKRKIYKIGEFEIEWIHITHSIIDASSLAITTEAGTIIHTGDFKIDHTPIDGFVTDLNRFAAYGEKGVLCLMSDSTNSYKEGITRSESTVGKTFDSIFAKAKGRVIMSTFSSNIHRVYQAIDYGLKYGRKVSVIGRSMERNLFTAIELGYIQLDKSIFIDPHEVNKYPDKDVLIVTTGSQGETMSALYRMATDEHRHVKIKSTDQIIISAKAIPGNEGSVSKVLNFLLKSGANVAYQDFSEIHVSGHAAQEEQKLILRLVKPRFFLPVHGEYNHITKHKETAMQCGIPERNIVLMSDGDQIEVCAKYMKKIKTVKTGKVFIDNQINEQIADDVVIDRQKLADSGLVMLVIQLDKGEHKLICKPKIISYGLVPDKDDKAFSIEMEGVIDQFVLNAKAELLENTRALENEIRQVVRKHIYRQMKKYPTIVPTIFMM
ncbi:ribonuclease J [Sulfurospirillum diekertiae]|uniref:Ribonuclease J n=1 Tax=Sulfurospirillum diekertiae TaxID=1854492 RepID=A0A6G9VT39_9BACT|nr:ribonuclease J [Sulfurospirillum diekertiae]QIR76090.1 ribonuclease J [Sulfurospirillum diekertiae]QIR78726.1 ribonuclease J [Sulfurospirillum diekertiae]